MAPVTTHSGKAFYEFDNARSYLADVVEMPAAWHALLADQAFLDTHVDRCIQEDTPRRGLAWGSEMTTPSDDSDPIPKFTMRAATRGSNVKALFAYVVGGPGTAPCTDARCGRIFAECIEFHAEQCDLANLNEAFTFACASCMFNSQNSRCSLYRDFKEGRRP